MRGAVRRTGVAVNLSCKVGGARRTFEGPVGSEVAGILDRAYGAEGDWELSEPCQFGVFDRDAWKELRERAAETLGPFDLPNLMALAEEARCVFLPAHVQAMSFRLSGGDSLRCASLPGLRRELAELAERWELPLDDESLTVILVAETDGGGLAESPDVVAFARLAIAANEAVRRDCPLWLVGEAGA